MEYKSDSGCTTYKVKKYRCRSVFGEWEELAAVSRLKAVQEYLRNHIDLKKMERVEVECLEKGGRPGDTFYLVLPEINYRIKKVKLKGDGTYE